VSVVLLALDTKIHNTTEASAQAQLRRSGTDTGSGSDSGSDGDDSDSSTAHTFITVHSTAHAVSE
jgi:hypothetical protein